MAEPVCVRCYDDCYWMRDDFGDRYTPPSSECGKDYYAFENLNIEPCYDERDETECPDCPFYINYDRIVQMESEYHFGEPYTNGDDIRSMSDEALAVWWRYYAFGGFCQRCPVALGCEVKDSVECVKRLTAWLQRPAESEKE